MFYIICLVINLTCLPLSAAIFEIQDLSSFKNAVQFLDDNTVVLLDIDYTLIVPCDAALLPCGNRLRKQYLYRLDVPRRELLQSIIALESEEKLIDDGFLEVINLLKEKNISVFGFTALDTGKYGKIENLEDWRLKVLEKLGIAFSSVTHHKSIIQLHKPSQHNGNYPVFKNGVVFTNRQSKGKIFTAFVDLLKNKPKKVIFIDDSRQYLESVEGAAKKLDIEFVGFHYRAAEALQSEFDEELGTFQFEHLLEHEHWLADKEARTMREKS